MSSAMRAGMGEWCVYDLPARRSVLQTEGAMKTSEGGVSSSISCASIGTSMSVMVRVGRWICVVVIDVVVSGICSAGNELVNNTSTPAS
jgi:hypothetical protein